MIDLIEEYAEKRAKKAAKQAAKQAAKKAAQQTAYQKSIEFAEGLLADGMSIDFTARHAKLPLEEVQKLAEQRSA